ncbi:MAG TPA: FKBP-type peptidyl-prolyl cis-trans isomerase [Candidatus Paceibacterota bacterium]|nr:FKBP-type peptidyl-prolyl cis-trans isomerase [Candidatus Paceibacterota bacterium]
MTKTILMYIILIAFVVVGIFLFARKGQAPANSLYDSAASSESPTASPTATVAASASPQAPVTAADGLVTQDLAVGTGAVAQPGTVVTVQYTGWLTNGTKFDSSYDHGQPFSFILGGGQVIKGWDEGVAGMKVGGKRKLTIPPALGYGSQAVGNGAIPANSTLVFEVELLSVQAAQ